MGRTLDEVISSLPTKRRRAIQARTTQLLAEEMTLKDLRKAMGKTQTQIAKRTGKPQATISRIEKQSDVLISTLNEIVEALGGRVRILAELPDREPVLLTGFNDIYPIKKAAKNKREMAPA